MKKKNIILFALFTFISSIWAINNVKADNFWLGYEDYSEANCTSEERSGEENCYEKYEKYVEEQKNILKTDYKDYYFADNEYKIGQHTYAFHYSEDSGFSEPLYHDTWTPKVIALVKGFDNIMSINEFVTKYTVPWQKDDESYYIALCLDMDVDRFYTQPLRRILLEDSTYVDNEIKDHVAGIVKHSYPFISYDDMLQELLDNNIIVEKEINGKKIYTSPLNNDTPISITEDEMLSAAKLALYNFTNPTQVDNIYFGTYTLQRSTILKAKGIATDILPTGEYDYIKNNITAVYNYLLTLEDNNNNSIKLSNIVSDVKDNTYIYYVSTTRPVKSSEKLTLTLSQNNETIGTYDMASLEKDEQGRYIVKVTNLKNNQDELKFELSGQEETDLVYVFEAVNGQKQSQTMVSSTQVKRDVKDEMTIAVKSISNPNTIGSISTIVIITFVIVVSVLLIVKKPKKYNN